MKAIGFKNFRRFENFPTMELGGVTLLVGGNNSGKSTVGKAARLVNNFLQLRLTEIPDSSSIFSRPVFAFDVPMTGVGLFRNALRKGENVPNSIEFTVQKKNFIFTINVSGNTGDVENSTKGIVDKIVIEDLFSKVIYSVDYNNGRMIIEFLPQELGDIQSAMSSLENRIEKLKQDISNNKDFNDIAQLNVELSQAEAKLEKLKQDTLAASAEKLDLEYTDFMDLISNYLMVHIIKNFLEYSEQPIPNTLKKSSAEYKYYDTAKKILKQNRQRIKDSIDTIYQAITEPLVYLPAHIARQDVFFKVSDKNDYMAQAIHEYAKMRIQPNDEEYNFIEKWMQTLEIADGFRIKNHDAEAYELRLLEKSDFEAVETLIDCLWDGICDRETQFHDLKEKELWNRSMSLGSKGMGSIHLVILLLQLATNIKRFKNQHFSYPTILIEEPELNLHPKLQSELADLFLELNETYHFSFIIETHSEYLIRKSQVLLGDGIKHELLTLDSNPFIVYYLTGEFDAPYKAMPYKKSGDFVDPFGPGFFDEAANLDLRVLLNEQEE